MSATSDYDAAQRAEATAAGRPTTRLAGPSVPTHTHETDGHTLFVFLRSGKLHQWAQGDKDAVPLNVETTLSAFDSKSVDRIVVADRAATTALGKAFDRRSTSGTVGDKYRQASRRMQFLLTLPASSRLVVLTDALSRKFWLPDGYRKNHAGDWKNALNIRTDGPSPAALATMLDLTERSNVRPGSTVASAFTTFLRWEKHALRHIASGSADDAIDAFKAATKVTETWEVIERFDDLGRFRAIAEGTVARIRPFEVGDRGSVLATVTQPFRLREGQVSILPDGHGDKIGSARLTQVLWRDDDGLIGVFSPYRDANDRSGRGVRNFAPIDAARAKNRSLLVTAVPYLRTDVGFRANRRRWTRQVGSAAASVATRDVPLDVILAGGPVTDSH